MNKIVAAAIAVIFAVTLLGSGQWPFSNSGTTYSGTPLPITIGISSYELSSLIYIAENQGFFAGNGLDATIQVDKTGLDSINRLLNDKEEVGLTSEFVVVKTAFDKENISVIGCIDKFETVNLVGRKDREIISGSDLKGKRIGLTLGTTQEFYLGRFLDLRGMHMQDVTLLNLQPSQYVEAITNGSVDALVAGNMFVDQIQKQLRRDVMVLPVQNGQKGYWLLACRSGWATNHPEEINRLLKSIAQAEEYTINHPTEAKAIIQKRLNYTDGYMAEIWSQHQYSLSLDQSLLLTMNDEGRWLMANNLTTEKTMPYFRDYIYTKGLMEVNPEAVNIR